MGILPLLQLGVIRAMNRRCAQEVVNCSCCFGVKLAVSTESVSRQCGCEVNAMNQLDQEKKEYIKPELQVIDICTSEILGDSSEP